MKDVSFFQKLSADIVTELCRQMRSALHCTALHCTALRQTLNPPVYSLSCVATGTPADAQYSIYVSAGGRHRCSRSCQAFGQRCERSYAVHEQAEAVFRYGDEGDLFYIILSGSVRAALIHVIGSLIRVIRRASERRRYTAAAGS